MKTLLTSLVLMLVDFLVVLTLYIVIITSNMMSIVATLSILLLMVVVCRMFSRPSFRTLGFQNCLTTFKTLKLFHMKSKEKAKSELQTVLSENPDPSKWSFWIKLLIAVLSAVLGIIGENALDICSNISNIF